MSKRTRDEITNPSKRQRREIDAVDTLAGVLNHVIRIPVDLLSHIRMYLYRATTPRIRFEGDRVFRFNYGHTLQYPWAGTERMRRRNWAYSMLNRDGLRRPR